MAKPYSILNHFELPSNGEGNYKAKCKHCGTCTSILPLQFWKENETSYLTLSKLACRYLAISASSGPVEHLFSIGEKFFRPESCRLTDESFEN